MDNKYGIPLYTSEDVSEAVNYLASIIADNNKIQITTDEEESYPIDQQYINDNLYIMAKEIVMNAYLINSDQIANCLVVQETFEKHYRDSILRYFKFCDIDAEFIDFEFRTIQEINTAYCVSGAEDAKPIGMVVCATQKIENYEQLLRVLMTTPFFKIKETFIKIPLSTNKMPLTNILATSFAKELVGDFDDNRVKYLHYKLLPSNSFYTIQRFIELLHKYVY